MFKIRLRNLRTEKDVTQAELAKILGVGSTTINGYEKGIIEYPPLDKMMKLADYFDVSIDYLSGRTPVKKTIKATNVYNVAERLQFLLDVLSSEEMTVFYHDKLLTPTDKRLLKTLIANNVTTIDEVLKKE